MATLEEIEKGSAEPAPTKLLRTLSPQPLSKPEPFTQTLLRFARDPLWQMIGIFVAIIGIAWPVYTFYVGTIPTTPAPTPKPTATIAAISTQPVSTKPTLTSGSLPLTIIPAPAPMAWVPAGEFKMGSASGDDDEKPVRMVGLNAFYIDLYEVTNAQFAAFLNDQGNQRKGEIPWFDEDDMDAGIYQPGACGRPKTATLTIPWAKYPGLERKPIAGGAEPGCPQRPSGKRQRGGRMAGRIRGVKN